MSFLSGRGWGAIWDKTKHFMISFFATICLYGLPIQMFHVDWNRGALLFAAAAVTLITGGIWEWIGNRDKWDMLADLCGVVMAVILIGVAI